MQGGMDVVWRESGPAIPPRSTSRRAQLAIKRAIDVVGSLLGLVALSPLLVILFVAIRLTSGGPALFKQERHGRAGRTFLIYKFRSMYTDAGDATGRHQTVNEDPRITPIGSFIRKTNLDELPQLFNVLQGDMSLVGPRPHPIGMQAGGAAYEDLVPCYHFRHLAKPGISGWAQVNGLRGPTTDAAKARARVEYDIAYVQNFSLLLDFRILLLTVVRELRAPSGS